MAQWDVVVIGGGAAGLSAATAAAGKGLSCLVIDRMGGGGELMNLGPLHDLDEAPTGPDLAARLLEEATTAGAELGIGEVAGLHRDGDLWAISTDDESHVARAVILATGLAPGTLCLDNESAYEGQGLSHCAACDGPLYRGQTVVVAGSDRWARQEAADLADIASQVMLVTHGGGAAPRSGVTVVPGRITGLEGSPALAAVVVARDDGGSPLRLDTPVLFVQTGRRPALDFAPRELARDQDGRIATDAAMLTNLPTLFAAGDVRAGSRRTLPAAMADGQQAAAAAYAAVAPLGKSPG